MNQNQINQLEMFQSTDDYLNTYTAVWSVVPIASQYKTNLSQVIDAIRSSAQDQEAAQVFIGSSMQQMKHQIADKLDILDDVLEAYADDIEDAELLVKASNSKSDYLRLSYEDFEVKSKNTIDLLETHVEQMKDYGLSTDQIDDAKLSLGMYQDKRGKPRSYRIASRVATQSLKDQFSEGKMAITRLDRVMKRFKRSNASFYNGYLAARTVVND
ncbi:hypothetical protein [Reichenbachiella sp.]|uniref:hypothetical protein n=1 Tax=Reichenbachiella sp. TaxID=2184521 RepID=UPI003296DF14